MVNTSIVSYVGISESGHCGYCKSNKQAKTKIEGNDGQEIGNDQQNSSNSTKDDEKEWNSVKNDEEEKGTSVVFGLIAHCLSLNSFNQLLDLGWSLWAHRLTVQAYQKLIDHGWRRSGRYLYKPLMEKTCCPQYTIRLNIWDFRLSRTQKRVLKTMLNFLKFNQKPAEKMIVKEEEGKRRGENGRKKMEVKGPDVMEKAKKKQIGEKEKRPKKKEMRRRRAEEKLKARGIDLEQYKKERVEREEGRRRTIESFLGEYSNEWKHKLEIRLVGQPSAELEADFEEEFQLYKRYQCQIHKDDEDELSIASFTRFLASSPLIPKKTAPPPNQPPLGSYHQQYRLDGRIIAVGVVDILPGCLSSKYFFYDPKFNFLSLGTYSALREIHFTQQLCAHRPNLNHYYMGFYLFDCPKMRYKGRFRPSELLCDHCFNWVPLSECDRMIEQNEGKITNFHGDNEPANKFAPTEEEMAQIGCIHERELAIFEQLKAEKIEEGEEEELAEMTEKVRNFLIHANSAAFEIYLAF